MAFANLGFETAGASPGLAASWTVTTIATAQALLDFGASAGQPPNPVETFEAPGWNNSNFRFAFQPGDTTVLAFGSGSEVTPIEGFETQWHDNEHYAFALSQTLTVPFTGSGQTGAEDFEAGWEVDASAFRFAFQPGDTAAGTFGEGIDTETFGDTFVASVVASTGTFTVDLAPDNETPIVFRSPAPVFVTAGFTYYVRDATPGGSTFKIAASFGGGPVIVGADGSGFVFDLTGPRTALAPDDVAPFSIGNPCGPASVVASTDLFTCFAAPPDGTAIVFQSPAPAGTTTDTTYYVLHLSSATFKVSTSVGGSPVNILADTSGVVFDIDTESFAFKAGTFSFVVDPSTDVFTSPDHTFVDGHAIQFAGPGLPTSTPAIVATVTYYARDVVAGTSFKVATTVGGSAIDVTSVAGTSATVFGDPVAYWNEAG